MYNFTLSPLLIKEVLYYVEFAMRQCTNVLDRYMILIINLGFSTSFRRQAL